LPFTVAGNGPKIVGFASGTNVPGPLPPDDGDTEPVEKSAVTVTLVSVTDCVAETTSDSVG
jgi:hypothetical protein